MEDSREGEGDDEKGRWMPSPHVDDEKKARRDRKKETGRIGDSKIIALEQVRGYFFFNRYRRIILSF